MSAADLHKEKILCTIDNENPSNPLIIHSLEGMYNIARARDYISYISISYISISYIIKQIFHISYVISTL